MKTQISNTLEMLNDSQGLFDEEKQIFEMFVFLIHWMIITCEGPSKGNQDEESDVSTKKKKVTQFLF